MLALAPRHATPDLSADGFRYSMRQLVGGVSVVTTGVAPERTGFTATSVASLSVDPPRLFFAVNKDSSSYFALARSGIFAVNMLRPHHQAIAERFSGRGGVKGEDRYSGAEWSTLQTGAAILKDALAAIDCEVEELIERHSHAIVIGWVMAVRAIEADDALLYWRGGYGGLPAQRAVAA